MEIEPQKKQIGEGDSATELMGDEAETLKKLSEIAASSSDLSNATKITLLSNLQSGSSFFDVED